ncbi:microcin-processing peptidase 2 [Keratinibaculum paraultunense]|uniref:Microcin-processing peptidase 2 n=1 Tax=Keratinibaculum paraultunense TaxID=1278232 RepID=A0A4R3L1H3_9FIRM|nr:TldD/PmbA family protein [Keratinibaculum paraultunense]QQY80341.1 TldD/PmbA family protein [Keratinibaculum paraultunense]TCS90863.1 microcin-processing peptidase 2 [Keratinibaculum paraultunense]
MLSKKVIENVLYAALSKGGDFAEVFVEDRFNTNIKLVGGYVENSISGRDFGVGIRVFDGLNSVYGYTNDSREDNLIKLAKDIAVALNSTKGDIALNLIESNAPNLHPIKIIPNNMDKAKKVELLKLGYNSAKNYDPLITQVTTNYFDEEQNVLIANSEGLLVEDKRVRTRFYVQSVASKDGEMQVGFYAPGASKGFEFYDEIDVKEVGKEASRIAKTMVLADYCPSGVMPVVIHNEFGGVLFHEACGHSLEATSVAKGLSVFANKLGEQIASPLVTAIDDGTLPNEWGSLNIDDEGTPTQKNVLIENGILKSYLIDKLNARRMNMESTGSGRRESYKFAPTSRMTNTFIVNGDSTFEEIISNTEKGLFAKKLGGGSVNPATGDFNFAVMEGYLIENGKITKPVRGASLIGTGAEVLEKIDMVGNNQTFGQGVCGSLSGMVPTNVGQPTIRIKALTVGGRKGDN